MSTNYPGALDSFVNPTATDTLDSATVPHATQHADSNDAIEALQVTLGVNPQGGSATVVARLTALDSTVSGKAATNQTMYVGTTAIAINRSSASQTLTGTSIDGNAATATLATSANAVPASGITGATLASNVTASSLTSFGTDPTANTQAVDNNSTKIATTAFVLGQAASVPPVMDGTAAVGTSTRYARADHVHGSDTTKANLSGATFTGAVAVSSGNLSQTGSGQVLVQSTSTSAVPVVVKPAGSLTITGLTASHSGGGGQAYDTISGFSSTVGLVAGQSVVLSGFSDSNFNGPTTITVVSATTIRVTSLNSTNGTGTGGQIVVTATQQNLQEWQYNSGTAVASVGASGIITASSFSGSGASLTALNGGNLTDGTVTAAKLSSSAVVPTLWYSPSSNVNVNGGSNLSAGVGYDPFNLSNGVQVLNSKTYLVDYLLTGSVTQSSTSQSLRVTIAGDAVANFNFITHQAGFIGSSGNGNWLSTNDYGAFVNGTTTNWQIGGTIAATNTGYVFQMRISGILRTGATGSYFQPQLGLSAVSGSKMVINRESFAALWELGPSSTTQQGLWT